MDHREVIAAAGDSLALGEEAAVMKKDEEVVNCICQLNEENGLMIQVCVRGVFVAPHTYLAILTITDCQWLSTNSHWLTNIKHVNIACRPMRSNRLSANSQPVPDQS